MGRPLQSRSSYMTRQITMKMEMVQPRLNWLTSPPPPVDWTVTMSSNLPKVNWMERASSVAHLLPLLEFAIFNSNYSIWRHRHPLKSPKMKTKMTKTAGKRIAKKSRVINLYRSWTSSRNTNLTRHCTRKASCGLNSTKSMALTLWSHLLPLKETNRPRSSSKTRLSIFTTTSDSLLFSNHSFKD